MAPTLIGVNHSPSTLCPYHQLVVACCTPVCTPGSLPTMNSSVIQSSAATMYQTLTYSDLTLRFTSVYSTGPMMQTKPATMKRPICHGISRNSMPSVQPEPMAPIALAMPVLISAPPSSTQAAP